MMVITVAKHKTMTTGLARLTLDERALDIVKAYVEVIRTRHSFF